MGGRMAARNALRRRCHALICVRLCHVAPTAWAPGRGANVGDTIKSFACRADQWGGILTREAAPCEGHVTEAMDGAVNDRRPCDHRWDRSSASSAVTGPTSSGKAARRPGRNSQGAMAQLMDTPVSAALANAKVAW
jgi:hypothetical protein